MKKEIKDALEKCVRLAETAKEEYGPDVSAGFFENIDVYQGLAKHGANDNAEYKKKAAEFLAFAKIESEVEVINEEMNAWIQRIRPLHTNDKEVQRSSHATKYTLCIAPSHFSRYTQFSIGEGPVFDIREGKTFDYKEYKGLYSHASSRYFVADTPQELLPDANGSMQTGASTGASSSHGT